MIAWFDRRIVLRDRWKKLPLARRFILSGALFTSVAMLLCGTLATSNLTQIALRPRADVVAAIAHHILAPTVQDLDASGQLDPAAEMALDALVADPHYAAEFPHIDIWHPNGHILYSSTPGLAGQRISPPPAVTLAFNGERSAQFTDVDSADFAQHEFTTDYIESYVPLLRTGSSEVIAVAQLRGVTRSLASDLWSLTLSSLASVIVVSLILMVGLFGIVLEGSSTIDRQARVLSKRLALSHIRAANVRELRTAAQVASHSIAEMTDKNLRTIGTDLHDGPAQSVGFAVLKLDQIRRKSRAVERNALVSEIETTLGGALAEMRAIALALVLPDIEELNLMQVIDRAIELHVSRTGLAIAVDNRVEPAHVAPEIAVCVFRFLQEGLNNAHRHGLPEGQFVSAVIVAGVLKLSISNKYIAESTPAHADHLGIGLYGLRARVQSVGGNFAFIQSNGETRLEMWLRHV